MAFLVNGIAKGSSEPNRWNIHFIIFLPTVFSQRSLFVLIFADSVSQDDSSWFLSVFVSWQAVHILFQINAYLSDIPLLIPLEIFV